jgi:Asp-tRNA(Asn)/Glu-tRNA(Gln) amidotransferase A subunit family amidase
MSASPRDRWRASAAPVKRRATDRLTDQVHWTTLRAKVQPTLRDIDALLLPTTMFPALPVETVDASLEVYASTICNTSPIAPLATSLTRAACPCPVGLSARSYPSA